MEYYQEDDTDDNSTMSSSSSTLSTTYDHTITEEYIFEIEENTMMEIDEYVKTNIEQYSSPDFHENLVTYITDSIWEATLNSGLCDDTENNRNEISNIVSNMSYRFFHELNLYPPRFIATDSHISITDKATIDKIVALKSQPQPDQRTQEWYDLRYNLITASNIYKALGTESQQNSLIYEKCRGEPDKIGSAGSSPMGGARGWGQKYEPVTAMIYEYHTGTELDTTFGCIRHPKYSFIGASPDGIVTAGSRIGHLVEIKNTVSREISENPIESHWIQCQVQMEVCDLSYCDYIQTNIKEYSAEEFLEDHVSDYKGVILSLQYNPEGYQPLNEFTPSPNEPVHYKYIYMPFDHLTEDNQESIVQTWIQEKLREYPNYFILEVNYWKLEDMTIVVIPRNPDWFAAVLPKFQNIWSKIEDGRKNGFQQYAPKKRQVSTPSDALIRSFQVSLLHHDDAGEV